MASFRLKVPRALSMIIKGKNAQAVRDVCLTAVTLGAFYTKYALEAKRIDAATTLALGGERDDQKVKEIKPGCLRVLLECFTDKRFLEVVDDVESGRLKERLEKEFFQIGITVGGLQVEIENMEEVKEWKEQILSSTDNTNVPASTANIKPHETDDNESNTEEFTTNDGSVDSTSIQEYSMADQTNSNDNDDEKLKSPKKDMLQKEAHKRLDAKDVMAYMYPEEKDSTDAQETPRTKFYARKESEQDVSLCHLKKFTLSALKAEIKRRIKVKACKLRQEAKINGELKLVVIKDNEDVKNIFQYTIRQGDDVVIVVTEIEDDSEAKHRYMSCGDVATESLNETI